MRVRLPAPDWVRPPLPLSAAENVVLPVPATVSRLPPLLTLPVTARVELLVQVCELLSVTGAAMFNVPMGVTASPPLPGLNVAPAMVVMPEPSIVSRLLPVVSPPLRVRVPALAAIVLGPLSVIAPEYVLLPLTLFKAPAGLAARPVPLRPSGTAPLVIPPWICRAAPAATVTPEELPSAALLEILSAPALIATGPVKEFEVCRFRTPVPFIAIPVAPVIPPEPLIV